MENGLETPPVIASSPPMNEREHVAIKLFTAYCKVREMNPADWPIIGDVKQAAWRAAADVAITLRDEPRQRLDR